MCHLTPSSIQYSQRGCHPVQEDEPTAMNKRSREVPLVNEIDESREFIKKNLLRKNIFQVDIF